MNSEQWTWWWWTAVQTRVKPTRWKEPKNSTTDNGWKVIKIYINFKLFLLSKNVSNNIFLADPGYCNSCILSPALQPVVSGTLLVTCYMDWYSYKIKKFFLDRKPSAVKNRRTNPTTYWQWLTIMVRKLKYLLQTLWIYGCENCLVTVAVS